MKTMMNRATLGALTAMAVLAGCANMSGIEPQASVRTAASVGLAKQGPDAFALVITDLTMPKMTGTILGGKIRRLNPNLLEWSFSQQSSVGYTIERHPAGEREVFHFCYSMYLASHP